jgi:asparagine synthase (glutamine-hydrolysing)
MEPHLPAEVLYRQKMGFSVPLAKWFRGPLRERVRSALLGPRLADSGYFNQPYLEQIVARHDSEARDYSASIWALLMFDAFLRSALDSSDDARDLRLAG